MKDSHKPLQLKTSVTTAVMLLLLAIISINAWAITTVIPKGENSSIIRSEYFADLSGELSIDEVHARISEEKWQALDEDFANFGYQPVPYWYRFKVSNDEGRAREQIIEIAYPLLDYVDYYEFSDQHLETQVHTGDRVPYANRPIEHPHFLFPITLEAGESRQIYLRIQTAGSQLVPLKLWEGTSLFIQLGKEDALHATYFGVVSVIIFFNLLIFIALREKMYLYYAASAFSYMLFFAIMRAKLFPHIFSESPEFHHFLLLLLPSSCLLFSALFSREFLKPASYSKTLHYLINIIIIVALIGLAGVFVFDSQTSLKLSVMSAVPGCFALFVLGPILGFMGNRMAWVYTAAWSTFMFGAAITAMSKQGLMPVSFVTEYGMQLGSALELFILNAALASRFYQEHRQRLAAQEESLREYRERRETERKLLDKSMSDPTTQLPNRACFEQQIHLALEAKTAKQRLAVCVIEILRYPEISRTLGHHNTDLMLIEASEKLSKLMDRLPGIIEIEGPVKSAYVCALEPGSFAMLIDADMAEAESGLVNELVKQLNQPIDFKEMRLELRPVIGVAVCPDHGVNSETLLRHAQVAADSSEALERYISYYRPEYDQYNARRLMMVSELKDAIKHDHLELYFQPKFNLAAQEVDGLEALVRWNHQRYGLIRPDEFIDIAEQTGIIRSLTRWVVAHALAAQKQFRERGLNLNMSINLSVLNLKENDLIDFLKEQTRTYQTDPSKVYLELTETSMMANPLEAIEVLKQVCELGFRLSVDDFGAGYSSLAYLKSLPASEIKIDKSLVSGICGHQGSDLIAEATIDMCHKLGYTVVAEGVEGAEIMARLNALKCDSIQGYLLTPPLPFAKLIHWLLEYQQDSSDVS